jgi:predicted dehydrogenase
LKSSANNILIAGAGQLGSRYLQGLSKCRNPLRIHVQDIASKSLKQAEQRWQEVGGVSTHHKVSFHTEINQCPQLLDLAIIATTANSRPEVVQEIAQHSRIRYWILEKVLAQNTQGLEEIHLYVGSKSLAWVNTSRRIFPWHQMIKEQLLLQKPLHMTAMDGPWGLACNAIHLLDLMVWWSGETLVAVCTDQLNDSWFRTKRVDMWEICGTLMATFSGGTTLKLSSNSSEAPTCFIELTDGNSTWRIDEAKGTAVCTDGSKIPGHLPYQSEITPNLVDEILATSDCQLPTLIASIATHKVFIDAMLSHWQNHSDPAATFVPIT